MIDIYTDGSCSAVDRIGGWAFVIVKRCRHSNRNIHKDAQRGDEVMHIGSGNAIDTTVNRMELIAIHRGMQYVFEHDNSEQRIRIISDSSYAIGSLSKWNKQHARNGWKNSVGKSVVNAALIRTMLTTLHDLRSCHSKVKFVKVKGHSGHHYNEEADRHAGIQRRRRVKTEA